MNRTLLRLSTQALFGRRRGVVLLLIAGALLVLALFVRLLTDDDVGVEAVVGLGFTLALPARRPARLDGGARPRDRRRLGRLPAREAGEPARHRGQQVRRGVGRHDAARRAAGGPRGRSCSTPSQPGRALAPGRGGGGVGHGLHRRCSSGSPRSPGTPWSSACSSCSSGRACSARSSPGCAGCRWARGGARWPARSARRSTRPRTVAVAYAVVAAVARHARRACGSPGTGCGRSPCVGTSSGRLNPAGGPPRRGR